MTIQKITNAQPLPEMLQLAQILARSTIVPQEYQGKEGNCFVALDMANRLGIHFLSVMNGLYFVGGKPAWSAQFLIAIVNSSGAFKGRLKFHMEHSESGEIISCHCTAIDRDTGEELAGSKVTKDVVRKSKWDVPKKDYITPSWVSMPQQMYKYRAAAWFCRTHCPELMFGLRTADEIIDIDASEEAAKEEKAKSKYEPLANKLKNITTKPALPPLYHIRIMPGGELLSEELPDEQVFTEQMRALSDEEKAAWAIENAQIVDDVCQRYSEKTSQRIRQLALANEVCQENKEEMENATI